MVKKKYVKDEAEKCSEKLMGEEKKFIFTNGYCPFANKRGSAFECEAKNDYEMLCRK